MPTLTIGPHQINYRESGEGPPVILLHCSSSHSGQWTRLSEQLSRRFNVISPDFFGYGKSDPLPGDNRPFFEHDMQIIEALIATATTPVHLVGHSLGGAVATYSTLRFSEKIASLTLIEPVLFNLLEESGDEKRYEYLQLAHSMIVMIRFGELEKAARLFIDFWIGPNALDHMDTDTRNYIIETIPRVADDWYGISGDAPNTLKVSDLKNIAIPTLVMCAEHTKPSARAIVEVLLQKIPNAGYEVIPDAGHMSPITNPDDVNALIVRFLDEQT